MENLDVYGVCNPIIDLLCHVPDSFLIECGLKKNSMNLITLEEQQTLLLALADKKISVEFAAGGSGANTMIGIAQLGGRTAFSGKIGKDEHGKIYREKMEEMGVNAVLGEGDGTTGSSLILVSDDGSRAMNTYLGMSQELEIPDISPEVIQASKYLYLTGYLWDTEVQKKAVKHALDEAKKHRIKVALSLSDPFCVNRHNDDFKKLLQGYASMVFCNQEEAFSLLETTVTQEAIEILSQWTETVVLTLGANGALIAHLGETSYIDPITIHVEDTTGAGDAFAAGFLYGMTHEISPFKSGLIGAVLAGAVIEQTGPRYQGHAQTLICEKIGIKL